MSNPDTEETTTMDPAFASDEPGQQNDSDAGDSADKLMGSHTYDGIQEYDNPLPGWWKTLFWLSILFSPVYYLYVHSGVEGRSIIDQYNTHMASIFELKFAEIGDLDADRKTIMKYVNDEKKWLSVGKVVYQTNCVSCHGADGGGAVGPNLTDQYWKNVRNVEDIAQVISEGAANGAMPAWKNRLSHKNLVVLTAAYVASLRENPVAGKKAEGDPIPEWGKK